LRSCRHGIESIHSVYDQFFQHQHPKELSINVDEHEETKFSIYLQRHRFDQLITSQKNLVHSATLEPSLWWFNYGFSSSRYHTLVREQHNVFSMLHNMHETVSSI
jgi:hypothetical protein